MMDESDDRFTSLQSSSTPGDVELLLNKLQGLTANITWGEDDAVNLFKALLVRFASTSEHDLLPRMVEMLHFIEMNYITPSWRSGDRSVIELLRDEAVTEDDIKTRLGGNTEKTLDKILDEIRQQESNEVDEKLLDEVKDIVSSVHRDLKSTSDGPQQSGLKKDLLKLCRAVKQIHYPPQLTQMVSWCLLALSTTGQLLQVGTGEGKSCIVAMFAAFRALSGEKVDIMSSSSVLAERDLEEWKKFYEVLNISVSCNTNKDHQKLKKCYECQVVYGTVEQFAGDWLRQRFQRMDIFGQRKFECAIVDEVDSLMLDKGRHVVYIGSDMPALQHLNPLLAFIWATVNLSSGIGTETIVGWKYPFAQVMVENTSTGKKVDEFTFLQMAEDEGILGKGCVKDLRQNPALYDESMSSVTVSQLAEFCKTAETRFPSCKFSLHRLNDSGTIEELNKGPDEEMAGRVPLLLSSGGMCQYMYSDKESMARAEVKRATCFTPCDLSQNKRSIKVPGFLSHLVECKLNSWIKSAYTAQTMTKDHEYILEGDRVVPVDYRCTGVVQNFMQWSDGLHQFLQMKNETKLSDMTAITNYMSNVGLFQKYGVKIFGVSGTLGRQAETETLQKIYEGIKTCQIPSFKRRKLFEVEGVIEHDETEWIEKICDVVTSQTKPTLYRGARAVLVICETINRAKVLQQALGIPNTKLYINNNMDNSAILAGQLGVGDVIIATNIAGRGTDLKVSKEVNAAGGLFVVQTFLPENARVEAQAFGRTARQGSPGSAQLIVCSGHLPNGLKLLVSLEGLQYLLENMNMIEFTQVYRHTFVNQLRLYQQSHSDEDADLMSLTLWCILTENSKSAMKTAKEVRDHIAAQQLASYVECGVAQLKKKEELFSQYLDTLDGLYESTNNKPSDVSALNEFWGVWLLSNFRENDSLEDLKKRLDADLQGAVQKLRKRESPSSNLHHYTLFGNELRKEGRLAESITMYTKAIQQDPCWAAIAYYNRAFASLARNKVQDLDCIDAALVDLHKAVQCVELDCEHIDITQKYSGRQIRDPGSDSLTRFDDHISARKTVLHFFLENITEAITKVEKARDFGGNVKVEEGSVYFLVPLVFHLNRLLLIVQSGRAIRSSDPVRKRQLISHRSFDKFNVLKCLESLGLTQVYTLQISFGGIFTKLRRWLRR